MGFALKCEVSTAADTAAAAAIRNCRIEAWRSVNAALRIRGDAYDRHRDLPTLLPLLPGEIDMDCLVLSRLERALKRERNLGRAGHWAYDLGRHFALRAAYDAEKSRIADNKNEL